MTALRQCLTTPDSSRAVRPLGKAHGNEFTPFGSIGSRKVHTYLQAKNRKKKENKRRREKELEAEGIYVKKSKSVPFETRFPIKK